MNNFMAKNVLIRKTISLILIIAFVFSIVSQDAYAALLPINTSLIQEAFPIQKFNLPQYLGEIQDSFKGKSKKTVIHIQEAHCNYPAQKQISEIIKYLQERYGIDTVNLEGGKGKYDLSLLMDLKSEENQKEVIEYFAKEGLMNGAEYFAALNPNKIKLWGVEESTLYLENLNIYRESLKNKKIAEVHLISLKNILNELKLKIYSKALLVLDKKYAAYKTSNIEFKEYLSFLIQEAKKTNLNVGEFKNISILEQVLYQEQDIDFKQANIERDQLIERLQKILSNVEMEELVLSTIEFQKKRLSENDFYSYLVKKAKEVNFELKIYPNFIRYSSYVSLYVAMDKTQVMYEIDELEYKLKTTLCINEKQKELVLLSKNLVLMKNLFNITLTQGDYKYYKNNERSFDIERYIKFILSETDFYSLPEKIANLDEYRHQIAEFYEYSFKRDKVFLKNLRFSRTGAKVKGQGSRTAILITGGFHAENLGKLFKQNNISYISILPQYEDDAKYKSPYFDLLAGNNNSLVRIIKENISNLAFYSFFSELGITADERHLPKYIIHVSKMLARGENITYSTHYGSVTFSQERISDSSEKITWIDGRDIYLTHERTWEANPSNRKLIISNKNFTISNIIAGLKKQLKRIVKIFVEKENTGQIGQKYKNVTIGKVQNERGERGKIEKRALITAIDVETEKEEEFKIEILSEEEITEADINGIWKDTQSTFIEKRLVREIVESFHKDSTIDDINLHIFDYVLERVSYAPIAKEEQKNRGILGFAEYDKIGLYEGLKDEPIALFHEICEYLIKTQRLNIQYKGWLPKVLIWVGLYEKFYERFKGAEWLKGKLIISLKNMVVNDSVKIGTVDLSGDSLTIALKGKNNSHYYLRALQRKFFGERDKELSLKIKDILTQIDNKTKIENIQKEYSSVRIDYVCPKTEENNEEDKQREINKILKDPELEAGLKKIGAILAKLGVRKKEELNCFVGYNEDEDLVVKIGIEEIRFNDSNCYYKLKKVIKDSIKGRLGEEKETIVEKPFIIKKIMRMPSILDLAFIGFVVLGIDTVHDYYRNAFVNYAYLSGALSPAVGNLLVTLYLGSLRLLVNGWITVAVIFMLPAFVIGPMATLFLNLRLKLSPDFGTGRDRYKNYKTREPIERAHMLLNELREQANAKKDYEVLEVLSYVEGFEIIDKVPFKGKVRDIAKGRIYISSNLTNYPQALKYHILRRARGSWVFDQRKYRKNKLHYSKFTEDVGTFLLKNRSYMSSSFYLFEMLFLVSYRSLLKSINRYFLFGKELPLSRHGINPFYHKGALKEGTICTIAEAKKEARDRMEEGENFTYEKFSKEFYFSIETSKRLLGEIERDLDVGEARLKFVTRIVFWVIKKVFKVKKMTKPNRNIVRNLWVPMVEETIMLLFLFSGSLGGYVKVRAVFMALHVLQDYGTKRTFFNRIYAPFLASSGAVLPLVIFGFTPIGVFLVVMSGFMSHILANRYITLRNTHFRRKTIKRARERLRRNQAKAEEFGAEEEWLSYLVGYDEKRAETKEEHKACKEAKNIFYAVFSYEGLEDEPSEDQIFVAMRIINAIDRRLRYGMPVKTDLIKKAMQINEGNNVNLDDLSLGGSKYVQLLALNEIYQKIVDIFLNNPQNLTFEELLKKTVYDSKWELLNLNRSQDVFIKLFLMKIFANRINVMSDFEKNKKIYPIEEFNKASRELVSAEKLSTESNRIVEYARNRDLIGVVEELTSLSTIINLFKAIGVKKRIEKCEKKLAALRPRMRLYFEQEFYSGVESEDFPKAAIISMGPVSLEIQMDADSLEEVSQGCIKEIKTAESEKELDLDKLEETLQKLPDHLYSNFQNELIAFLAAGQLMVREGAILMDGYWSHSFKKYILTRIMKTCEMLEISFDEVEISEMLDRVWKSDNCQTMKLKVLKTKDLLDKLVEVKTIEGFLKGKKKETDLTDEEIFSRCGYEALQYAEGIFQLASFSDDNIQMLEKTIGMIEIDIETEPFYSQYAYEDLLDMLSEWQETFQKQTRGNVNIVAFCYGTEVIVVPLFNSDERVLRHEREHVIANIITDGYKKKPEKDLADFINNDLMEGISPKDSDHPFRFPDYIWQEFKTLLKTELGEDVYQTVKTKGLAWTDVSGNLHWIDELLKYKETKRVWSLAVKAINNKINSPNTKIVKEEDVRAILFFHEKMHEKFRDKHYQELVTVFREDLEKKIGVLTEEHSFIATFAKVYGKPHAGENIDNIDWYIEEFLALSIQEAFIFRDKYRVIEEMIASIDPKTQVVIRETEEKIKSVLKDTLKTAAIRHFWESICVEAEMFTAHIPEEEGRLASHKMMYTRGAGYWLTTPIRIIERTMMFFLAPVAFFVFAIVFFGFAKPAFASDLSTGTYFSQNHILDDKNIQVAVSPQEDMSELIIQLAEEVSSGPDLEKIKILLKDKDVNNRREGFAGLEELLNTGKITLEEVANIICQKGVGINDQDAENRKEAERIIVESFYQKNTEDGLEGNSILEILMKEGIWIYSDNPYISYISLKIIEKGLELESLDDLDTLVVLVNLVNSDAIIGIKANAVRIIIQIDTEIIKQGIDDEKVDVDSMRKALFEGLHNKDMTAREKYIELIGALVDILDSQETFDILTNSNIGMNDSELTIRSKAFEIIQKLLKEEKVHTIKNMKVINQIRSKEKGIFQNKIGQLLWNYINGKNRTLEERLTILTIDSFGLSSDNFMDRIKALGYIEKFYDQEILTGDEALALLGMQTAFAELGAEEELFIHSKIRVGVYDDNEKVRTEAHRIRRKIVKNELMNDLREDEPRGNIEIPEKTTRVVSVPPLDVSPIEGSTVFGITSTGEIEEILEKGDADARGHVVKMMTEMFDKEVLTLDDSLELLIGQAIYDENTSVRREAIITLQYIMTQEGELTAELNSRIKEALEKEHYGVYDSHSWTRLEAMKVYVEIASEEELLKALTTPGIWIYDTLEYNCQFAYQIIIKIVSKEKIVELLNIPEAGIRNPNFTARIMVIEDVTDVIAPQDLFILLTQEDAGIYDEDEDVRGKAIKALLRADEFEQQELMRLMWNRFNDNMNVKNFMTIFNNESFISETQEMPLANKYSIANSINTTLKRFDKETTDESIEKLLPFVLGIWKKTQDRIIINKDRVFFSVLNSQERFDMDALAQLGERFGVQETITFKGSQGSEYDDTDNGYKKEDIKAVINDAPDNVTFWFDGHADPDYLFIAGEKPNKENDEDIIVLNGLHYQEFAEAVMTRAKEADDGQRYLDLSGWIFVIDACRGTEYIRNMLNYLYVITSQNGIILRAMPLMISSSSDGEMAWGTLLIDALNKASADSGELKVHHFMLAETQTAIDKSKNELWQTISEDPTIAVPLTQEEYEELREILGVVDDAAINPGSLHPNIPILDMIGKFTQDRNNSLRLNNKDKNNPHLEGVINNINTGKTTDVSTIEQRSANKEEIENHLKRVKELIATVDKDSPERKLLDSMVNFFSKNMPEYIFFTKGGRDGFFGIGSQYHFLAIDEDLLNSSPLAFLHEIIEHVKYKQANTKKPTEQIYMTPEEALKYYAQKPPKTNQKSETLSIVQQIKELLNDDAYEWLNIYNERYGIKRENKEKKLVFKDRINIASKNFKVLLGREKNEEEDPRKKAYFIANEAHYIIRAFTRQVFTEQDEELTGIIEAYDIYQKSKEIISEIVDILRKPSTYVVEPCISLETKSPIMDYLKQTEKKLNKDGHNIHARSYLKDDNWEENLKNQTEKMLPDFIKDIKAEGEEGIPFNKTRMVIRIAASGAAEGRKIKGKMRIFMRNKLMEEFGIHKMDKIKGILSSKIKFVIAKTEAVKYVNTEIDLITDIVMAECDRYGKEDGYLKQTLEENDVLVVKFKALLKASITNYSNVETFEIEKILRSIFSGTFVLNIKKINWESIKQWKFGNDEILKSL